MQSRKKQRIIIGTLCAIIVGMVVGYAALSQILNINGTSKIVGTFDIQFTKISENTMTNATTIKTDGVGTTTATFNVDLQKPGSSAIYDVTVENKGTIDAILKSIEGIDESNLSEPLDIKYSLLGLEEGDELNASASKNFQVKVIWDSTSTSIPNKSKTLTLKLNYEQKTSSSGSGGSTGEIASTYLIENALEPDVPAGGNGFVAIDNTGAITTSTTPREYRYIGSNPDNYVSMGLPQYNYILKVAMDGTEQEMKIPGLEYCKSLASEASKTEGLTIIINCEKSDGPPLYLWRIIGIFDGQLKLIQKDSIGRISWDKNGGEDWSTANLQKSLNGEYLDRIDITSQGMISDYTWKLGGSRTWEDVTAQMFYERERGTEVPTGNPTEWTGKIALMYPSDYGFATSGGATTNRDSCLSKVLYNWKNSDISDCKNNNWLNWLYDTVWLHWTLTPGAPNEEILHATYVFYVDRNGSVRNENGSCGSFEVHPSLYLKPDVKIISGTGTEMDPYILGW